MGAGLVVEGKTSDGQSLTAAWSFMLPQLLAQGFPNVVLS